MNILPNLVCGKFVKVENFNALSGKSCVKKKLKIILTAKFFMKVLIF